MAKPSEGKHENLFIVVNYYNRYCKIQICLLFGSITLGKRKSRSEENDDEVDLLEGSCGVSSRVFCSSVIPLVQVEILGPEEDVKTQ